jgi:hypothetical protein
MAIRHTGAVQRLPGAPSAESVPSLIGPITLDMKHAGKRNAGNPPVPFDVAGAGNVAMATGLRARAKALGNPPEPNAGAPVLDPTDVAGAGNARMAAGLRARVKALEQPPAPNVGAPVLDPTCEGAGRVALLPASSTRSEPPRFLIECVDAERTPSVDAEPQSAARRCSTPATTTSPTRSLGSLSLRWWPERRSRSCGTNGARASRQADALADEDLGAAAQLHGCLADDRKPRDLAGGPTRLQ